MIHATNMVTNLTTEILGLEGFARVTDLSISAVAAQTAALDMGAYDIWTTTDCYIKVSTTATGVTTSNGYLLRSGNTITIAVGSQEKVGAITSAAAGTLSMHRVK